MTTSMTQTTTHLRQDPQFEDFLYAPVGEDRRGVRITVLSMLARLGRDPWGEASELAALPQGAARKRLEALMAEFEDVPFSVPDRNGVIAGLLTLLPGRTATTRIQTRGAPFRLPLPAKGSAFYWIALVLLVLGWVAVLARAS